MTYNASTEAWHASVERPDDTREIFSINANISPDTPEQEKIDSEELQLGYLSLIDGEQQPVNEVIGVPKGTLKQFLYKPTGEIEAVDAVEPESLADGERYITIYFPPGYDENRNPPYHLQITLDGGQYLKDMHLNHTHDNLLATGDTKPVIDVFISPYTGPPNESIEARPPVTPQGYPISQRFKEYSCNPQLAQKLADMPSTLHSIGVNVTTKAEDTTNKQRDCLEKASQKIALGQSLIPQDRTYKQHLSQYQLQTKKMGLKKCHGLRYAYAQRRYHELTKALDPRKKGLLCPRVGGKNFKDLNNFEKYLDRRARGMLSRNLGHSRIEITKIYCG